MGSPCMHITFYFSRRRMQRAKETGGWFTALSTSLNGTVLSEEEFRDSLRLSLTPQNLPSTCDGCSQGFTVERALWCQKGGLTLLRHNDVTKEWSGICREFRSTAGVFWQAAGLR